MSATTAIVTSRQLHRDPAGVRRAAVDGPVFITTRGKIAHVLISKAEFDRREPVPTQIEKVPGTP